jgi:long-chain acyl-CoA synthetase
MTSSTPDTLVSLFAQRVATCGDQAAVWNFRDGEFRPETWAELAAQVDQVAAALIALGVKPGDRVVQWSENRREWIITDLAILLIGAIHVPIHAPLAGAQAVEQINDCGAQIVIVSGADHLSKLDAVSSALRHKIQTFTHEPNLRPLDLSLQPLASNVQPARDDVATIIYTSGTTGEPKGAMLTHGNLVSNTLAALEPYEFLPDDARLGVLPLSHIFARTCDLYMSIASGVAHAIGRGRETILDDCRLVRPTLLNAVPYFYDKVMRTLQEAGRADEPGALQKCLGGRMRMCISGGAALPDHVAEFFNARGIFLGQGYGLTETSPVITFSTPQANRIGASGRPIRDVEVRIAADGEILTRGPHVMRGYWNKPEATRQVLDGGWFATGDLGRIDEDGYLFITGRKKELIVTAAGKNVAPVQLEALLTEDPLILQAMVIGDGRNYLTALIVPNPDPLKREILARGIPIGSREEALVHPQVRELYAEHIKSRLAGVSTYEQVKQFTLLGQGFTIETGELTPTLKLRREVIARKYAPQIAAMYQRTDL